MKDRIETLKEYLKRLGDGEPLEAVRKDFVEVFKDVDPAEIMKAEQEMLAEGTPLSDVQKLCDVHAALFHGKTREEQIANAEKAVHASTLREERETKTRELAQIKGHPLWLFANENGALAMLLEQAEEKIKDGSANKKTLESLRGISIHYAKKGDLLYPVLNVRYGISGPASVSYLFIMPRKGICYIRCLMYDIKSADLRRLCGQLMMRSGMKSHFLRR